MADIKVSQLKKFDPLVKAIGRNDCDDLKTLILRSGATEAARRAYVNRIDTVGDSALIYASKTGSVNVVRCLLNHGADANHQNVMGNTALVNCLLSVCAFLVFIIMCPNFNSHSMLYANAASSLVSSC
jgi:hypothetical protein